MSKKPDMDKLKQFISGDISPIPPSEKPKTKSSGSSSKIKLSELSPQGKNKTIRLTLDLEPDTHAWLARAAKKTGQTKSGFLRTLLEKCRQDIGEL
ncbi:MAG: hypothetical protein F6K21_03140 [Symploca sp. SIO2D2]|nr:hypothetical protein [Symploca sp. SIO2D2]